MKRIVLLTILFTLAVIGCSKKNEPAPESITNTSLSIEEVTLDSGETDYSETSISETEESVVEVKTEDELPRYTEDEYTISYFYYRENGDFTSEREQYMAEYNFTENDLIEKNEVEVEGSWGEYIISLELYYSKNENKYYVFYERYRKTDEHRWFGFAKIKQLSDRKTNYAVESFVAPDPYNFLSIEGETGENAVEGYREEKIYDDNGNLTRYTSYGVLHGMEDEGEQEILDFEYTYNKDNVLTYWKQYQNSRIWGTQFQSRNYHCDQNGKLLYLDTYITYGSQEYFYIYEENQEPKFIIYEDWFCGTIYMYKY